MIKAGTKYKVLSDSENNFKPGDIVVALEEDNAPYCCLLEDYDPNKSIGNYNFNLYHALPEFELEALDDRTEE